MKVNYDEKQEARGMAANAAFQRRRGRGRGMSKKIAFGYYGGKYSHLEWLLPLLPVNGITHYCEPFAGSAAVLINRTPAPIETYNDLDGEVVNFFRVLRTQKDALLEQLSFTPYARGEYLEAIQDDNELSDLERARRFYIRIRQVRGALADATPGRWGYVAGESRNGMSATVSRFYYGLDNLADIALRFLCVQFECLPALDVIGRYDTKETLFYLDPPYTPDSCYVESGYKHILSLEQHRDLLTAILNCRGKVAISGYENPLYMDLLSKWHLTRSPMRHVASSDGKQQQECLWTNYNPATVQNDLSGLPMFSEGVS